MDYATIRTSELPQVPIEPQRGSDNEYLSRLHLNSIVFVFSQTPEQKVNDVVVYKNRDRILFEEEKFPITLTIEFNRELFTFDGATIQRGWIGSISIYSTRIYPYGTPTHICWTPEEACADLLIVLHNSEKVRELYKEAHEIETW